jgi:hypothetical protein
MELACVSLYGPLESLVQVPVEWVSRQLATDSDAAW